MTSVASSCSSIALSISNSSYAFYFFVDAASALIFSWSSVATILVRMDNKINHLIIGWNSVCHIVYRDLDFSATMSCLEVSYFK